MHTLIASAALLAASVLAAPTYPAPKLAKRQDANTTVSMFRSGLCETTPGVDSFSGKPSPSPSPPLSSLLLVIGYIQAPYNQNFFYWFFQARNNPETAPLTIWFNGGPGCSSMIGLFQEHGPCTVLPSDNTTTVLNPYSWNNISNMIYIDQPISTGFSYGNDTVTSTYNDAAPIWEALQVLYADEAFANFTNRDLNIFTESYGGHYGPAFATYFEQQNNYIDQGYLNATKLNLKVLGINNGWYDPLIQNIQYSNYSLNNGYMAVINQSTYDQMQQDLYMPGGCVEQTLNCYTNATDEVCQNADNFCTETQFVTGIQNQNSYYILGAADDPFPYENYVNYLNQPSVLQAIGAQVNYTECADAPYEPFYNTGDDDRTILPELQKILNNGTIRTLIWAGEVDFNCNWFGSEACLLDPGWEGSSTFANQAYQPLHYSSGNMSEYGSGKTVGNLTFLRIQGAGHEVPAYRPLAAYEVFSKMINNEPFF